MGAVRRMLTLEDREEISRGIAGNLRESAGKGHRGADRAVSERGVAGDPLAWWPPGVPGGCGAGCVPGAATAQGAQAGRGRLPAVRGDRTAREGLVAGRWPGACPVVMLVHPAMRARLMAVLRSEAMIRGRFPVRTREASSRWVVSRIRWTTSTGQWCRMNPARSAGVAWSAGALVTASSAVWWARPSPRPMVVVRSAEPGRRGGSRRGRDGQDLQGAGLFTAPAA